MPLQTRGKRKTKKARAVLRNQSCAGQQWGNDQNKSHKPD